jgi:uncharacterized membrane protein
MSPRVAAVLGIVAVAAAFALFPVGIVLGVVTIVGSARALRATRAQPQELMTPDGRPITVDVAQPGRGAAALGLALGIVATTLGVLVLAVVVVFLPQLRTYESCHNDANTVQGTDACTQQFKDAVHHRLGQ